MEPWAIMDWPSVARGRRTKTTRHPAWHHQKCSRSGAVTGGVSGERPGTVTGGVLGAIGTGVQAARPDGQARRLRGRRGECHAGAEMFENAYIFVENDKKTR